MMTKILLINPNQWGRGITHLWVASHSSLLRSFNHNVELFDATFYNDWSKDETGFNTKNQQYKPTNYSKYIKRKSDINNDLQSCINKFNPEIILISAISSHIHGEGEYINIELGNILLQNIKHNSIVLAGGIQPTASPEICSKKYREIDVFLQGDSEFTVLDVANLKDLSLLNISKIKGTFLRNLPKADNRERINLSKIPPYDYEIFDKQTFLRPYRGKVIKAVDYEFSRGCIFSCSYCVETVIQSYLGFNDISPRGNLKGFDKYLSLKSVKNAFTEIEYFEKIGINMMRCQDTNFLTIPHNFLKEIIKLKQENNLKIGLYIETRPETINTNTIKILKGLNVIGVGMGVETASEDYREDELNRFSSKEKTIKAFKILKDAGIKRSSYNILGLPGQTEKDIINTIEFNKFINPDNITVSFYSPFLGTKTALKGIQNNEYDQDSLSSDSQLRTNTFSNELSKETLEYYKENFNNLCRP